MTTTSLNLTAYIENKNILDIVTGENTIIAGIEFDVCYYDKNPDAHEVYCGPTISVSNFRFRTPREDYTLDEALDCGLINDEFDFKQNVKKLVEDYISHNQYIEDGDEIYPTFSEPTPKQIGSEMKIISITSRDISEETRQFLMKDLADYVAAGFNTGLFFAKETLTPLLEEDYFDENDKPADVVLEETTALMNQMSSTNANFLFFN